MRISNVPVSSTALVLVLGSWAVSGAAAPLPSPGCEQGTDLKPGESVDLGMAFDGLDRQYRVHLPPDYGAGEPVPLLLDFHGYTGQAAGEEEYTGLSELADRESFVVVYPQGTGFEVEGRLVTSWNDLAGSRFEGPEGPICATSADTYPFPPECGEPEPCVWATCHDDLAFVEAMLDRLETDLCLDLDRVYATGMSNGGMFVHRLGCDLAERFAAIAPVGGTLARGFACAPEGPLSMINIWGDRDHYVSQEKSQSTDGYFYSSARAVLAKWAGPESQNCQPEVSAFPTSQDGRKGLSCVQHDGCETGAEVVHCTWDGEHDWPSTEGDAFGNELIWEFLSRHRRSAYR